MEDLRKTIHLNNLEAISLTKEYLLLYLRSMLQDSAHPENRKILMQKLQEYYQTTKTENSYLRFLIKHSTKITNEDTLNKILDNLDSLNEQTYLYYDEILRQYEDNLTSRTPEKKIVSPRTFQNIIENQKYLEEIVGLTLTRKDLEAYFERFDAFHYLKEKTKILDTPVIHGMDFFGCYPIEEQETNTLIDIKLCVPEITDLHSMLINIHEYKHGIDLFPYLGKQIPRTEYEILAHQEEENYKKTDLAKKLRKVK